MKAVLALPLRAAPALIVAMGLLSVRLSGAQVATASMGKFEVRPGIPASDSELSAAVQAHVARGDWLTGRRRYEAAEQEYRNAVIIVRREGHLPSLTLWHLASAYYYQGDPQRAAGVLDVLRVEAQQFGDLAVEALALFNSAWLSGQAGRTGEAGMKIANLRRLLRSSYMPAGVRHVLGARLSTPTEVAVEP